MQFRIYLAGLAVTSALFGQNGLSAKYPGDVGIGSDPDVLFTENFEGGDLSQWDEIKGPVAVTGETAHSGNLSVRMPMQRGRNTGGHTIKWFMPGADTVYVRFYVKFSADYQYNHHFVWLMANQAANKWSGFGKAGLNPNGTYYSSGMEPAFGWGRNPPPGEVNLYSYFLDMLPDDHDGMYWGNSFYPPGPERGGYAGPNRVIPPLDQWQCWEFMIQANSAPDAADGRQAMWVDGQLVGEFSGIRWRSDMDLKVNYFVAGTLRIRRRGSHQAVLEGPADGLVRRRGGGAELCRADGGAGRVAAARIHVPIYCTSLEAFPMRLLVVCVTFMLPLAAQIGGSGSIQGTVTDPSGAAIPGATVVAVNAATEARSSRQTTEAGYYVISPLPAGEYSITVTANGFQTLVQKNVVVDALATVGANFSLKIGAATESVTVTDILQTVNTTDARVGQTIRNEMYTALPLAMGNAPRDPTAFVQYMPGVVPGGSNAAGQVYGSQANSQEVYVEGLPVTNSVVQGEVRTLGLGISVEAVDQFQLESAGASVQYGGQGATNFSVKGGSNRFHGAAYEFFRNTLLDARGFFPVRRAPEHQNEFGFNVGGPVIKNRLFFFGSYDGFRYRTGTAATLVTVPTSKERAGDFSQLPVGVFDPLTTANVNGVNTRQVFPGNAIPANRISPASKFLAAQLPNPTYDTLLQTNYLGSLPTGFNNWNTTNRVDYNLNDRNTLFALYSRGHRSQSNSYRGAGNSLPLPYTDTRLVDEIPTTAQVKHTFVARPNLINQVSFGLSRFWIPITNATIDGDWMNKAGVKGLPAGEAASSFPEVAFGGPNPITGWRGTNSRAFTEAINNFTLQDNVQWTHGRHSITLGVQLQWLQANEKTNAYGSLATWNFSNNQTAGFTAAGTLQTNTGHSYASYLLGAVNSAGVTKDSVVGTGARYKTFGWWLQDNFKVTGRLTLNLGLRHDILLPYVEVLDRESFFNPNVPNAAAGGHPGILMFMGHGTDSCGCRSTVDTDYKLFGPRIGVNYALSSKTVIRSGYTVMYTHRGAVGGRGNARTGTGTLGYSASPSYVTPDSGITPAFYWDKGVPPYDPPPFFEPTLGTGFNGSGKTASTMTYGDPQIGGRPPMYQNWNFGLEHALTPSLALGVNYVGSNGHYLSGGGRGFWSDQIDPRYLALGNLLQATATPANLAAANAIIPGIKLPFPTYAGAISQMLRPFPQYQGVTDAWGDVANSSYNSLQVTLNKRLSHGLVFNSNYVFAKAFGDDTGSRSAYNWKTEKAQQVDPSHTVNLLLVYTLPIGMGQRWGSSNKALARALGNWQISSITTYRSGLLIGTLGANCNTPNAGSCYAAYNPAFGGPVRTGGDYGSGDVRSAVYLDKNAFASPAPFTYGNTPRTGAFGLRGPANSNESVSMKREWTIREGWKFALEVDALNVFNSVRFAFPNFANITNANFGKITGVANSPRVVQLVGRFNF